MKKVVASLLMVLFASGAVAAEMSYVLTPLSVGGPYADPCPTAPTPDVPVPANGYCSEGMVCPVGYDAEAKWCFSGGLHQCGIACKDNGMYRN